MQRSLRTRLTVTFIGLSIGPLVLVGAFLAQRSFAIERRQALNLQRQVAQSASTEVESFLQAVQSDLRLRASEMQGVDRLRQQSVLLTAFSSGPHPEAYQEIILLDDEGLELLRRRADDWDWMLGERTEADEFLQPMASGDAYTSPPWFDQETGEPFVTLAVPMSEPQSETITGVLVADVKFGVVSNLLADQQAGADQTIYLMEAGEGQSRLIAHQDPFTEVGTTFVPLPAADAASVRAGLGETNVLLGLDSFQFGEQTYTVVAQRPASAALELAISTGFAILGTSVAALVIAVVLGLFVVRQIVSPVEQLSEITKQATGGDLSVRAAVSSQDEIGELAHSFNVMAGRLNDSIRNLENRVAERTRDLKVASDVSRQATTVLEIDKLLPQLVALTRQGFGLDLVSIFLYDDAPHTLSLAASTGEAGRRVMATGRTFQVSDGVSPVVKAARERRTVVANDVPPSQRNLSSPSLESVQSEIALPMIVGHTLVGVLHMQSTQKNRFAKEDREILVTLGEQIAITVRNAQLFEEAREARTVAEQANVTKTRFLANMSHELRTPLNAILNFTSFVMEGMLGPVTDEQTEALSQSLSAAKHLLTLINDVLDLSKIETGMMDLFIQEVNIDEVLSSTVAVAKGLVQGKDIELIEEVEPDIPATFADKRRLRQVALNLVSNAVKFTERGSVTISARHEDGAIHLTVADTGIGIAPEDEHLVFESFKQAKHDLTLAGGTGLGMPIAKYFVESHQGEIWFESEKGEGTTFHVRLPILTENEAKTMSHEAQLAPAVG